VSTGTAYIPADVAIAPARPQQISPGLKRLGLAYVWLAFATSGIVIAEPAPHDLLLVGATVLLPLLGLVAFNRALVLYLLLWVAILAASFIATAQAGVFDLPVKHVAITSYLALSSVVIAGFVLDRPDANVRLIMSAYVFAAVVAATVGLLGGLDVTPRMRQLFASDFGRVHGTFKDANVLGAFLVPPLLYALNVVLHRGVVRGFFYVLVAPVMLLASLLAFSRGAWINLAVALAVYAGLTLYTLARHRDRVRLALYVLLSLLLCAVLLAVALTVPTIADLLWERASFDQSYDVGREGRFGGQAKALGIVLTHPLGIGALEFARVYHHEDAHQVYLSMFLNGGWVGGTAYLALVGTTIYLALRHVARDRGGNGISAVLAASFLGVALEGIVVDTDHWRHFFLIMALIWGVALAPKNGPPSQTQGYGS
jgi:hypothetical protein